MLPKNHLIINLIISVPFIFLINPIYVLIFFLSSFLIDIDHYLYYAIAEKDISLKNAYKWYMTRHKELMALPKKERKKHKKTIIIFHGLEPLFITFLISFIFYPFVFVFLGFLVHMIEDLIEDIPIGIVELKLSLIYSIYMKFKHTKIKR